MIKTVGRALRRSAGGGVILVLGVGAVGSQPPGVVATSAASALPIQRSVQAERSAPLDERASILAIRAGTRSAAAAVNLPLAGAARPSVSARLRRVPAMTRAAAAPPTTTGPAPAAVSAAPGNSAGYAFGYCTWWVSHKRAIPWHSNAAQWWWSARAYGFAEGSTPRAGAVMVMGYGVGGASSSSGHVGYVESVNPNGSFVISEMNWWGVAGGGFGKVDYRTVSSMNGILGFIY